MLNIIFAGTPEFAVPALEALLHSEHRVLAVYTQPDRPAGRGRKLQPGPVKALALAHGIDVLQPESFVEDAEVERLRDFGADLMVVAAYGLLLPPRVLTAPRLGCINIHASLLPRWRGASPIQQAILAGDSSSGVTLMQMDQGLDTGAMIASQAVEIEPNWTAGELHDALGPLGARLLIETLDGDVEAVLAAALAQDDAAACYAPRLHKGQAEIDWRKSSAELLREIRAYNPWPVSYSRLEGENLRLWRAVDAEQTATGAPGEVIKHDEQGVLVACGEGSLRIVELQFAGRNRVEAAQVRNARDLTGQRLGDSND